MMSDVWWALWMCEDVAEAILKGCNNKEHPWKNLPRVKRKVTRSMRYHIDAE